MGITNRFVYLLCGGIIFLILALFLNNSFTVFIIYNLTCAALLIIDYFITIDDKLISMERSGINKLSIYEKEAIVIIVYNKSNYKLYLELKDEIPDFYFQIENKIMKGEIKPKEKKTFEYYIVPTKRGAFIFKDIHVKCRGRLKLCTKIFKVKINQEYKVYPNMKNLRKYKLNMCNNRSLKQGQNILKTIGKGTSFESLREYVPFDEYRKINWKATARENKPIINQYEPEKNQHIHILIDTGRAMSYTVRGYRKLDLVVNTALVLSDVVNQNGDKSGLMVFNTKVDNMIMPGKGTVHRGKIMDALYHIDNTNKTSNYDDAFYYLKKKERHRSIVFFFTDFSTLEEAESLLKVLPIISKNNLVIIILIKNESIEVISSLKIRTEEDLFNKGVALEILNERCKIMKILNRKGIFCIECAPEQLEYTVINKYIQVKTRTYL
ncbi:DUF58 domain-containing protein [Clostridium estertheticum]|uniref:DUF58 domain-containing protein n=1 Tax=Clostridium estertheticum TaxID=238834 RepID=UPI001C6E88E7|nr:DUF58 domain-containing protein [Clostridium estertheticum]MBW9173222.1 DUF58 domain-containing protein [Clostridium estertheticum]WLC73825.1 DUF58 domain-containing protein [Clostridium estertheticum]